jgi:hypothetical protein
MLEKRGFSRPVGTDDADRFPMGDPEMNTLERFRPIGIAEGYVLELNHMMTH